jgi:hypothetical protein
VVLSFVLLIGSFVALSLAERIKQAGQFLCSLYTLGQSV